MAKKPEKIAVFAKNHQDYLREAVSRNAEQPERFTTFRSSKRWVTAHAANAAHGTLLIYFAPVGGEKGVEYTGLLHQVHLNPSSSDPVTKEVLAFELDSTRAEGLWDDSVKTLYVVSHCERLARSFPLSALIKAKDRRPLSDDFKYSYAVVREETALQMPFDLHPEEIEEPARYLEGATRQVSVNVYERNAAARKACLNHYGCVCAVCGFDFAVIYGEIGDGFIHVHHLKSGQLANSWVRQKVPDPGSGSANGGSPLFTSPSHRPGMGEGRCDGEANGAQKNSDTRKKNGIDSVFVHSHFSGADGGHLRLTRRTQNFIQPRPTRVYACPQLAPTN